MHYELAHLTQTPAQDVIGPIQDDEASCSSPCAGCAAPAGSPSSGANPATRRNFLAAVRGFPECVVYTVDPAPVPRLAPEHVLIPKSAKDVRPEDFDRRPLDLVFFDCHDFFQQMAAFRTLSDAGVITRATTLALHDTGTHPAFIVPWSYPGDGGFIHQPAERAMANAFQDLGYECVSFHAPTPAPPLPFRHGLTLCRPRQRFINEPDRGPR